MRRLVSFALLLACLVVPSAAGAAGSAAASPVVGPVVRAFSVTPGSIVVGRLPLLALHADDAGQASVQVRVDFIPVRGRGSAAAAVLGWQPTGQDLSLSLPPQLRLVAGRYAVRVQLVDRKLRAVTRAVTLTVLAVSKVSARPRPTHRVVRRRSVRHVATPRPARRVVRTRPKPRLARPVRSPRPARRRAAPTEPLSATGFFPVRGWHTFGDGFGVPRVGHVHEGQDVLAAEGTPIVAPIGGVISQASYQAGGAGYYVVQHSVDGRFFFYAHCERGSIAVVAGQAVAPGRLLCRVGATGDATGPHLHFEIWIGGWHVNGGRPIDPLPQLRRWSR